MNTMKNDTTPSRGVPPQDLTQLILGLYKKGPAWTGESSAEIEEDQRKHLALLARLAERGDLLLAGPIADGSELRGILICNVDSTEKAEALFAGDAHVNTGRLVLEFHPWFVSAATLHKPLIPEA
jgi:uncharacterized protein YciI